MNTFLAAFTNVFSNMPLFKVDKKFDEMQMEILK